MNPKLLRSNVLRRIYADAKHDAIQEEAHAALCRKAGSEELALDFYHSASLYRQLETEAASELLDRKESLQ